MRCIYEILDVLLKEEDIQYQKIEKKILGNTAQKYNAGKTAI